MAWIDHHIPTNNVIDNEGKLVVNCLSAFRLQIHLHEK